MKAWLGHWCVGLLAAALILPIGLAAQESQPVISQDWINQTVQQSLAQAHNNFAQLMEMPGVEPGWLGVSVSEVTADRARQAKLAAPQGVRIDDVEADSPAAKAGLKADDIVVSFNGQKVEGVLQFDRLVRETPPGRTVAMEVWRDGREQRLSAEVRSRRMLLESRMEGMRNRLQEMPRSFAMVRPFARQPLLGVRVEDVSGQLGQYFGVPGGRGVLVVEVTAGSVADKAGLKAGDVIYQVQGEATPSVEELRQALRSNCAANAVSLGVVRKGLTLEMRAPVQCPAPPAPSAYGYSF